MVEKQTVAKIIKLFTIVTFTTPNKLVCLTLTSISMTASYRVGAGSRLHRLLYRMNILTRVKRPSLFSAMAISKASAYQSKAPYLMFANI
jgi:hypothetical protein